MNVAVILAGCGVYDGAEIQEAVCSLLALDRAGHSYRCLAPDIPQHHVIDHRTGEEMPGERNVLTEAARIARGDIAPLAEAAPGDFQAVLLPGGFGAGKQLSTFAFDGAECRVEPAVRAFLTGAPEAGLPIGALCISPVILARLFGGRVTIGSQAEPAAAVAAMGAEHVEAGIDGVVVDAERKLVTSPCYMLDARVGEIAAAAERVVAELQALR